MALPRTLAKALVTVAAVAALSAPAVVALATGWITIHFTAWNARPGPDPTPVEAWALLALVYLVWVPLVVAGLVIVLDRLGFRYAPVERDRRPSRKQRRRRAAGLRYLQGREAPPAGAPRGRPRRPAPPPEPAAPPLSPAPASAAGRCPSGDRTPPLPDDGLPRPGGGD